MATYFFILGREKKLALAEIAAWAQKEKITWQNPRAAGDVFLVEADYLPLKRPLAMLAGTVKFGEIIGMAAQIKPEILAEFISHKSAGKINFGLSAYNFSTDLGKLGAAIKKILKIANVSARFVSAKEYPLSAVIVAKNKLLSSGCELILIKENNTFFVGRTLAVQNFELFGKLDYGRPASDPKKGMLPPKLAQIMVNLSGVKSNGNLLDPFCGCGTVLQQAAMLGFTKLTGADLDQKAITMTKKNLLWLKKEFALDFDLALLTADAATLEQKLPADSFNAIVTEADLGPPLRGGENATALAATRARLENLYGKFLRAAVAILKKNGVLIMAVPAFKTKTGLIAPDIKQITPRDLFLTDIWDYGRADQHLIRKICRLEKK